jgi:hypothetical protein
MQTNELQMIDSVRKLFTNKLFLGFGTAAFLFFTIKGLAWLLVFYFGFDYLFSFLVVRQC